VGTPTAALGDPAEFLDIDMNEFARVIPFVTNRTGFGCADNFPGHWVQLVEPWQTVAPQYRCDSPGWHPGLP